MRGASLVKVFNLLMLCEVIAYILSRQRLSAKTFVTGCVFYALQDRLSLWMLCDTTGVGGFPLHFSTGSPFGHHPRLSIVCPLWGQWVRAGRFPFFFSLHFSTGSPFGHHLRLRMVCPPLGTVGADWEVSFFSPSPLLHFSTSPRVHPSGITRGYAWCVPSRDSGCGSHHKKVWHK